MEIRAMQSSIKLPTMCFRCGQDAVSSTYKAIGILERYPGSKFSYDLPLPVCNACNALLKREYSSLRWQWSIFLSVIGAVAIPFLPEVPPGFLMKTLAVIVGAGAGFGIGWCVALIGKETNVPGITFEGKYIYFANEEFFCAFAHRNPELVDSATLRRFADRQGAKTGIDATLEKVTKFEAKSEARSWSEAEAVEALLSIYINNPNGFAPGYGDSKARAEVREIGEALNQKGGMELMLRVHSEFQRRTSVFGAPRNLEHTWDGIGDWRG